MEDFKHDVAQVACLILEEGFNDLAFLHKSIAEYFAAAYVRRRPDGPAAVFYSSAIERYSQWQGVLNFLERIDEYRFAKHFFLPSRESFLQRLQNSEGDITDASLRKYIDSSLRDATIELADADGKVRVVSMRREGVLRRSDTASFLDGNFFNEICTRFLEHLPPGFDVLEDTDCFYIKREADDEQRYGRAVFSAVFKAMGYDSFISASKVIVSRYEAEIDRANARLSQEERKIDLLAGLL